MLRSLFGRGRKKRRDSVGVPAVDDSIRGVRVGDVLSITGLALEYDDVYFFVERLHRYTSDADTWHELICADGDNRIWVEWTDGYDLFITATADSDPVGLESIGLTEEDLIDLDKAHSIDNFIEIDDGSYYYRNSSEAYFYQDSRGPGVGFYVWDFIREQGDRVLSVTKWEGKPFEVSSSEVISPDRIIVYKGNREDSGSRR
jgi:hypothetical protein